MVRCKACGILHSPMIRCEVARNLLSRAENQKRVVIELGEKEAAAQVSETVKTEPGCQPEHAPVAAAPSKRWDKAAYNLYMREYMRAWRKKK